MENSVNEVIAAEKALENTKTLLKQEKSESWQKKLTEMATELENYIAYLFSPY